MKYATWLLTAAGAVTAISLAAPVHADNTTDAVFLDAVDRAGIEYADPQEAVSVGRQVCDYLAVGHPTNSAARALKISNHHLSLTNAAQFVVLAQATYCPVQAPYSGDGA